MVLIKAAREGFLRLSTIFDWRLSRDSALGDYPAFSANGDAWKESAEGLRTASMIDA
jgi:hypothetical protein